MNFDPTETIDGMPLIQVRDFLRERRRHFESAFEEADVTAFLGLRGPAARRWLKAAIARRLVEPNGGASYDLAPEGIRLATTKFVPRIDRAKADRIVADLLQRTEAAAAARWDYLVEVSGLAVFGSYRDEQASDVGDVDVLIGTRWLPEIQLGEKGRTDRCWDLFERDGRRYQRIGDHLKWPQQKLERFLRGRSPYISLHSPDVDAKIIETDVRVIYELPAGRLAPPRDCRPAEFVEFVVKAAMMMTDDDDRRNQ
jgi:hypothetical protein